MSLDQSLDKILIIDFGSQFTQLIARRIRELGVFSEIVSHKKINAKYINNSIKGIVLSGGPLNVNQKNKFSFDKKILKLNIPILGICFGHQILSKLNGGTVKQSKHREFGLADILLVTCLDWAVAYDFKLPKNISNYHEKIKLRDGYKKAVKINYGL